jgi:ribosomal protein S18 acetylase RimI-like enzyme
MTSSDSLTGFVLREATPSDAARLAEFGARTFRETFAADNSPEDMERHLASAWSPPLQRREIEDPDIDTLILENGAGEWLAFAQLRANQVSDGVPAQGSIELWRFYVDAPWQGRGVAGALMQAAKDRGRRRGASTMWLGVWERNARAQAFYRKHGFGRVGRKVFVVGGDPQTDDVMLCALA